MDQILESLSALLIPVFDAEGRPDEFGWILWCVFAGVVLVFLSVLWQNATVGKAIRILRERGARTESTAISLSELGRIPAFVLNRKGSLFGKTLVLSDDPKVHPLALFLPEKNDRKADAVLKNASAPLYLMLLELVAFYLVLLLIYHFLPWVLSIF